MKKKLLIDIETLEIGGKTYIWEFGAIDVNTKQTYHIQNKTAIDKAIIALETGSQVNFFGETQAKYCKEKQVIKLPCCQFYMAIQRLVLQYRTILAYNVNFDKGKLEQSGVKWANNTNFVCLWGSFVDCFVNAKYCVWAMQNKYTTKSGLPSTNAEIAFRYLVNPDYKHLHFALDDCFSELAIYEAIKKRKGKWKTSGNWQAVQSKMKKIIA